MAMRNNAYNNYVEPNNPVRYNKSKSDLRRVTSISPVPVEDDSAGLRKKKPAPKVAKVQKPMTPGIGGYFY